MSRQRPPPPPIELCLEDLDDKRSDAPYLRCVAVAGGNPGLCFSPDGGILWQLNQSAIAELWVSLDEELVLYRTKIEGSVSLTRLTRHLELPLNKPVIVRHGDEIQVQGQRYRIHLHGKATQVVAPERLGVRRARQAIGAAFAIGALATSCKPTLPHDTDGSVTPPGTAEPPAASNTPLAGSGTAPADPHSQGGGTSTNGRSSSGGATANPPPIEVRDHPPAPMPAPPLEKP